MKLYKEVEPHFELLVDLTFYGLMNITTEALQSEEPNYRQGGKETVAHMLACYFVQHHKFEDGIETREVMDAMDLWDQNNFNRGWVATKLRKLIDYLQEVRAETRARDIADRLRGVGGDVDLEDLLQHYIQHRESVPEGLDHEELIQYRNHILREL